MGGNKVLENRQAFTEVGADRGFHDFAGRFGHQSPHPGKLPDLGGAPAGAGIGHHVNGIETFPSDPFSVRIGTLLRGDPAEHLRGDLLRCLGPDIDDLVVSFSVGDQPVHILLLDPQHVLVGARHDLLFVFRYDHVVDGNRDSGAGRVSESDVLQAVGQQDGGFVPTTAVALVDQVGQLLLVHDFVDCIKRDGLGDDFVQDDPSHGGLLHLPVDTDLDPCVQIDRMRVQRRSNLLRIGKDHPLTFDAGERPRQIVDPQNDVLAGDDDRHPVGRRKDVVGRHHQDPGFTLRLNGKRHVNGHLIAVEVGVEGGADQRMELDGLPFDQDRLECLQAEAVQCRRPVQHDRIFSNHLVEGVPHLGCFFLHQFLGALDRRDISLLLETSVDERFEKLQRHFLGKPALMQPQIRADRNDGASGIIDPFPEEVLAEAALFSLEHVRKGTKRALVRPRNRTSSSAVVEQNIHRFLQHPFLVADDDFGRIEFLQPLQAVVSVDDPPVEIIQVGGGKAPPVQRNQRSKVRRDHGKNRQNHPLRPVS